MRVPSGVEGKFSTQKPAIDKVAEHIDDVVTVAESITSGQFDKVSVPAVKVVATSIKEVKQVAEVEQYVRMLAQDLSNIDLIGSQLAGVLNVSNNMAVVLLLHSRMADLLDIKKSLVHIDAVALNEERINSVYEIIPDIATLVSHTDKLVRIAGMEPQLNAVFQNLNAIFLIGSNVGHIVNVSTNMETILEASANAGIASDKALEAKDYASDALTSKNAAASSATTASTGATTATTKASEASSSASAAKASQDAAKVSETAAKTSENNAKTQADRAKTEADRAKQISGLSTVSDAIGLAALPLPDVWAPLSDSLQMITGYGREVKVGEDVVARMANFSRSTTRTYTAKDGTLKIAAINEPCFEKEGLHLDVQSTNMVPTSNFRQNTAGWGTPNPTGNLYSYVAAPDGTSSAVKVSFVGDGFNQSFPSFVVGTVYTFSFYAKNETATDVIVAIRLGTGDLGANVRIPANTAWTRYSVTSTFQAGDSTLRWYFSTKNVEVSLWGAQLEALPFASSYIPTNGAAVTRAGDYLRFIGPGNHPDIRSGVPFTFAMRMSCEDAAIGTQRDVLVCENTAYSLLRRSSDTIRYYRDGSGLGVSAPGKKMNVIAVKVTAEDSYTLRVGASQATRTGVPYSGGKVSAINISNVAGHVRDFRIWQYALTDDQIKAIA